MSSPEDWQFLVGMRTVVADDTIVASEVAAAAREADVVAACGACCVAGCREDNSGPGLVAAGAK